MNFIRHLLLLSQALSWYWLVSHSRCCEQSRLTNSKYNSANSEHCCNGNQCSSNPCHYGGHCKDGIGSYTCTCLDGYQGKNCEFVIPKFCRINNGDCEQFCSVRRDGRKDVLCSCADGYALAEDGKRCVATVKFPCGKVFVARQKRSVLSPADYNNGTSDEEMTFANGTSAEEGFAITTESPTPPPDNRTSSKTPYVDTRIVGGDECPPGQCPWQAVLIDEEGEEFCGGTVLSENFILTAAHCINQSKEIKVTERRKSHLNQCTLWTKYSFTPSLSLSGFRSTSSQRVSPKQTLLMKF
uniref:Coagulation factor Xa n=1 Tax=Cyanistes caeruleus TaxID=156563 RepID=A0A8C0U5T1_CYACU